MSNTINIAVTLDVFLAVCAKNSRASDFTEKGLEAVFNKISETMINNNDTGSVSVNSWLIAAGEQTPRQLSEYLIHLSYENTEELMDAAKDKVLSFGDDEIDEMLEAYKCHDYKGAMVYSDEIWEIHQTKMLENEKFVVEMVKILADADREDYQELSNGNWISFT